MKTILLMILMTMTLLNPEAFAQETKPQSDVGDTYNFYFQKGPGAKSVQQGGAPSGQGETRVTAIPASESPAQSSLGQTLAPQGLLTPTALEFSANFVTAEDFQKGYELKTQFNANERWGIQLGLLSAGKKDQEASWKKPIETQTLGNSLALNYAIGGWWGQRKAARISLGAGLQYLEEKTTYVTYARDQDFSIQERTWVPTYGINMAYRLNQNIGVNASVQALDRTLNHYIFIYAGVGLIATL